MTRATSSGPDSEDVENIKEFYAQVGDHVPQAMYDELAALEARLKAAR